ncbi:MAG TPA: Ppx/GppA family phosphatase [Sphingobium sp.]|nr:Ppx/GppA family phosphatase [Sphingobium sp.]
MMSLVHRVDGAPIQTVLRGPQDRRTAIIDIGSNSIRLVVYDGPRRVPFILFNEKVLAGLGAEIGRSGRIGPEAMVRALAAIERFVYLCEQMAVDDLRCVATAAVRDASNGPLLVERAAELGLDVRTLSGAEESATSALGLLSGIPDADGIVGDLGGGSLELARVRGGKLECAVSLPLGVFRVAEIKRKDSQALSDRLEALLVERGVADLERGLPFYLIGGSWRELARLNMQLTSYPLPILHHYDMTPDRPDILMQWLRRASRADLKAMPALSGARLPTLPDAARLLCALVERFASSRLTVSAFGLREGLLYAELPADMAAQDPLLSAARVEGAVQGRFVGHGDQISGWIAPVFVDDPPALARIRHAACLLADVGWRANPDFRAERGLDFALHGNWAGISAAERAAMGQALYANFGGTGIAPTLPMLADPALLERATQWGLAIRLCQRLTGGAEGALRGSSIMVQDGTLILRLQRASASLAGEAIDRRLRQLGQAMGLGFVIDLND